MNISARLPSAALARVLMVAFCLALACMTLWAGLRIRRNIRFENQFRGTVDYSRMLPQSLHGGLSRLGLGWVSEYCDRVRLPYYAQLSDTEIAHDDLALLMDWHQKWVYLFFFDSNFSNEHARQLSTLPELEMLRLEGTRFTGDGFRAFEKSSNLTSMDARGLDITDDDIRILVKNHSKLILLQLGKTGISSEAVYMLGELPRLRGVTLSCCDSISPDVEAFKRLPPLAYIHLDDRIATTDIINALKSNSPEIVIHIDSCSPEDDFEMEFRRPDFLDPGL